MTCKHHKNCVNYPKKCKKCEQAMRFVNYDFFEPRSPNDWRIQKHGGKEA